MAHLRVCPVVRRACQDLVQASRPPATTEALDSSANSACLSTEQTSRRRRSR